MASTTSKLVLGLSCSGTLAIISYVHYKQQSDRDQMHEGVVRDIERQQRRKTENIYMLEKQKEMTNRLKNDLSTSSTNPN